MRISLKDALFIGFCAVFIPSAKAVLRLHLKIPGHSMFFSMFFLLIARGCVRHRLAASFCGLLAGSMAVILVKFLLPALMVDLMAGIFPGMFQSVLLCVFTGGLAASTRMLSTYLIDILAGMDPDIVLPHAWLQGAGNVLFGIAGGIAVPAVIRKLTAYGAIHNTPWGRITSKQGLAADAPVGRPTGATGRIYRPGAWRSIGARNKQQSFEEP